MTGKSCENCCCCCSLRRWPIKLIRNVVGNRRDGRPVCLSAIGTIRGTKKKKKKLRIIQSLNRLSRRGNDLVLIYTRHFCPIGYCTRLVGRRKPHASSARRRRRRQGGILERAHVCHHYKSRRLILHRLKNSGPKRRNSNLRYAYRLSCRTRQRVYFKTFFFLFLFFNNVAWNKTKSKGKMLPFA